MAGLKMVYDPGSMSTAQSYAIIPVIMNAVGYIEGDIV